MFKRRRTTPGETLLEVRKSLDQSYKIRTEVDSLSIAEDDRFSQEINSMKRSTQSIIDSLDKTYKTALEFEKEAERFKKLNLG